MQMNQKEKAELLTASAKKNIVRGMEQFLRNFSKVPDEKLTWSPTPTSKSPIRIAAHTAVTAANFANMIRERKLPSQEEIPEFVAKTRSAEEALINRSEVESVFRKNTDDVLSAIDTLTPDDIELVLDSSQGWSMPITFLINLPAMHADWHTGQIDFLQTCWDDQEIYV